MDGPSRARAARALSRGDPVGALAALGARDDPECAVLRGVALAQLDELDAARRWIARGAAGLEKAGASLPALRAQAALAELDLAQGRLEAAAVNLARSETALAGAGDAVNAAWTRALRARCLALAGRADEAARLLEGSVEPDAERPELACAFALARADLALRRFRPEQARAVLGGARADAARCGNALLEGELGALCEALERPVARLREDASEREVPPVELPAVLAPARATVVVDAICRRLRVGPDDARDLAPQPVLFQLLHLLAAGWPEPVPAGVLIERVFEERRPDESHHVRLRVALGRLRDRVPDALGIAATGGAWRLAPPPGHALRIVEPLSERPPDVLVALLADGAPWAARTLAEARGRSVRTVQRALASLREEGRVEALGRGRARRWVLAERGPGIASRMLLVGLIDPR